MALTVGARNHWLKAVVAVAVVVIMLVLSVPSEDER
jgi:hypothetical protein